MAEIVVLAMGRAVSSHARAARAYKQRVYDAAKPLFPVPLAQRNIRIRVDYFYASGHVVDLDNLLKCVLDGLKGAAYEDDSQVEEVLIRRYNVSVNQRVEGMRVEWVEHLTQSREFVSIVVAALEEYPEA